MKIYGIPAKSRDAASLSYFAIAFASRHQTIRVDIFRVHRCHNLKHTQMNEGDDGLAGSLVFSEMSFWVILMHDSTHKGIRIVPEDKSDAFLGLLDSHDSDGSMAMATLDTRMALRRKHASM